MAILLYTTPYPLNRTRIILYSCLGLKYPPPFDIVKEKLSIFYLFLLRFNIASPMLYIVGCLCLKTV